ALGLDQADLLDGQGQHALSFLVFFFQAEGGIRDWSVTGVQTCALPISCPAGSRSRIYRGESPGAVPRGGLSAVAGALLDRGSDVFPVARRGELAVRPASRAQGSVCRHRVLAGPAQPPCRARTALPAGHAAGILPGGSAGGRRLRSTRDSDAGGPDDGAAGRTDRGDSAARAGAHTASRLSGQPDADRGGKPGVLSPRGVVDFRCDSRRARELL